MDANETPFGQPWFCGVGMSPVIGIDLGTTNSCVAYIEDGVPIVIPNKGGYKVTPSVVAVTPANKRLVGQPAKRQSITNPSNTVSAIKRLTGRIWGSPLVEAARITSPFDLVEGQNHDVRVKMMDKVYSVPEIQAMILSELRQVAEDHIGEPVNQVVITVPAYFKDAQRQSTKDAGKIAGLDVLRIINEPTAAALAYGYGKKLNKKVAIYDLGGGTFDISILEIHDGVFEVLTSNGDTFLGGEDFDARIVDWLLDELEEAHGIDLRGDKMATQRLKDAAETAKIALSSAEQTDINLPFLASTPEGEALHLERRLLRSEYEEMVEDLVSRTVDICDRALQDIRLKKRQIDELILVGGQTRMPLVFNSVKSFFGRGPLKSLNPDEAVALGAAIQANMLIGQGPMEDESTPSQTIQQPRSNALLLDLTPHSLGIEISGGYYKEIVPKDSPIPISRHHIFTTERDNQEEVDIIVVQGEEVSDGSGEKGKVHNFNVLGEFRLTNIKKAPRGETKIKVFFDIDANGTVTVSAMDLDTGDEQSIIVNADSYLSDNEITQMIEDNRAHLLQREQEEAHKRAIHSVQQNLKYIRSVLPIVRPHMESKSSRRRALEQIEYMMNRADEALAKQDTAILLELEDFLEKTKNILRKAQK